MTRVRGVLPRLALNAQLLRLDPTYRSAGIARYILNLLAVLGDAAPDLDLHAFAGDKRLSTALKGRLAFHLTRWPTASPAGRIAWEQFIWPVALAREAFDLIHSLAYVSPLLNDCPSLVTVYDTSFADYPELFRPLNRFYLQAGTRRSVRLARRVISISESTRRDLVRLYGLSPDYVDVVYPGVDPSFFVTRGAVELDDFRRTHRLPDRFVLFLGTLEPRKNLPVLIRAFVRAKRERRLVQSLVIAGGRGWMDESIQRTIVALDARDDVLLPGYLPQEELALWYRAADAFVYPSRYEGFGMPPLEAQACGTPVVTSKTSSLPEAVGDAALLVDPDDETALSAALIRILTDRPLREELSARGPEHARGFSWKRAAEQTAAVYRRALQPAAQVAQARESR